MATFVLLQQELADRLNLDATLSANVTRYKRWINLIQNDIASRANFEWLYKRVYVQTIVDKTAGTVAITNGATAVTGTGTSFAAIDVRSFIQFENDTNWYEVTARSSTTAITIGNAFQGATLTAGTYTLRTVYYDLPTDCFKVFDVRQSNTPLKLTQLGLWTTDLYRPDINTTGNPTGYYLFRNSPDVAATASKQRQIAFYPAPDDEYNIEVRYFLEQTDLSADTDIPYLPVPFHTLLVDGAEWLGAKFLNDPNERQLKQAYEYALDKMISKEAEHGDYFPVLGSSDDIPTRALLLPPGHFENI